MSGPLPTACYCGTCATCASGASPRPAVADPAEYRHGAIKRRLLASIASAEVEGRRPLEALGTREDDDAAVALLDAVAGSLHVLAWNAARLSDDGSIRRTGDRDALVDLTRLLGYEPRPALAATTTLAFTVDKNAPSKVAMIPKGSKVASVPGQDEKPQTFETDAEVEVRLEWNELKPRLQKVPYAVDAASTKVAVEETTLAVKRGDMVAVYFQPQNQAGKWLCGRVSAVERLPDIDPPATTPSRTVLTLAAPVALTPAATLTGNAFTRRVAVLGERAAAFGANAPDLALLPGLQGSGNQAKGYWEWTGLLMSPGPSPSTSVTDGSVDLDALHEPAVTGGPVLFDSAAGGANATQLGQITGVKDVMRRAFAMAAKVTQLAVHGIDLNTTGYRDKVRETAIYIETARGLLVESDLDEALPGTTADRITLAGSVSLPPGRRVVLTGERWMGSAGVKGPAASEVAIVKSSTSVTGGTLLAFERALATSFRSTTLRLFANAVGASHGETPAGPAELLGSGTAAAANPRFPLKRAPLTYVPAPNARGYRPAIEVRVGDRLYDEAPTLFRKDSAVRLYSVKTVREGKSVVQFAGRLPSGTNNVSAVYRTGGGLDGNLAAGRISTAMTPVLGVSEVRNAVVAEGGSDAETTEELRDVAPQSIRTLDRVVSLADYEAFARTRRGVGKALATELHVGMRSVVCLTIATTALASPVPGSDIVESLREALALVAAPGRSVRIEGFDDLTANLTAALAIDKAFRRADVEAAARQAIAKRFGRAARRFGEALTRSAVMAVLQAVPGVLAVRIDVFALPNGPAETEDRLLCPSPRYVNLHVVRAGLLAIDAAAVQFAEMTP